jgi:[acyl-carrier-protein] S-malonyltransferase
MGKVAYIFPGQGAQHVGMGKDLVETYPAAAEVFEKAEKIIALPLRSLCFEGPEEQLNRTDLAQPAIFTHSAACLAVMREQPGASLPAAAAGLSLGEYTALYFCGAMDFETALKLVAKRGELMQQAALARPSGMVAVVGLDEEKAERLCQAARDGQVLSPANFNCPGQIVLSGETAACERAAEMAAQFGARGATVLKVAGAFHSELMAPAAEALAKILGDVAFRTPDVPVLANVDAEAYRSAEEIPRKLLAQLTGAVRWRQSMEALLADGFETFYEVGPGKVLAGLMRRIDRKIEVTTINGVEALAKLV